MYKIVLFALAMTLSAGCSLKQDPLAGRSEDLRNAKKPGPQPEKPAPVETDNLVIDAPDAVTFSEGVSNEFQMRTRVLLPEYDQVDLLVENIDAFPGATFDAATGVFRWTPPAGIVGTGITRQMLMNVRTYVSSSTNKDARVLTHGRVVVFAITKNPQEPTVSRISNLGATLREDDYYNFHIYVNDPDASAVAPELIFTTPRAASKSLAPYISIDDVDFDSRTQVWDFSCRLNLYSVEITNSMSSAGFSVKAITSYGKSSQPLEYAGTILTDLQDAKTTWQGTQTLKPGVENRIPFVVYNPAGEGLLSLDPGFKIPAGSSLSCVGTTVVGSMQCEFVYTPVGVVGRRTSDTITMYARTRNTYTSDTASTTTYFTYRFEVEAL